ncbi:cysteine--tRNA ligase [Halobacterium salinarum]|uniref:Cysteine--tRNA ligase n=1 Tax=Halobacterium salinarum (strain ATCC 33171 / DSM 3754 / JCM 8978 / NBRC 102687 / NCIMB 764 / 91-R6) TaxID=2597657 RepID=A0A4D6GT48_HALS9|nr:cysteine--tRNA ligase [Halobacterium salinarum]MDL0130091.1 cysteine--tRNA ligase [Halobacterium salinarum]QCC44940.1 cysteine--tRNA ligase [Halobacterium salinarum]TYO74715.1 cysteinyl-tRNA synthetase [Halobacterium salinarum DSM 3754]
MTQYVSNTRSGEQEAFEPDDPENVLVYTCGLTVSDDAHLGHARLWVQSDVMTRWLSHAGYGVRHVQNVTDVNEKIVARVGADGLGDTEAAVAAHYTQSVIDDMRALNLARADVYPRVSEHVPEIIDLIGDLVDAGYAYEAGGSVYFDVRRFEEYGALSGQQVDELDPQGPDAEQAEKRHPADFALWKAGGVSPDDANTHRDDELPPLDGERGQTWASPWGEGRPGWHIECSAMAMTHLDDHIDIHVGGQDLVFPHHENEIAQSEAASGERFADHWLHVRLLETDGEKMSSSLGNFFTVSNAVAERGPNVVRMLLVSTSYTQRQTYSEATVSEATQRWERLQRAYERAADAIDSVAAHAKPADDALRTAVADARGEFAAAMRADFNTRAAVSALLELASAVNRHVDGTDTYDYQGLHDAVDAFETLGGDVLGLQFDDGAGEDAVSLADDVIDLVLDVREQERTAGNYERADDLRDRLEALGVSVEDTDDGATVRR